MLVIGLFIGFGLGMFAIGLVASGKIDRLYRRIYYLEDKQEEDEV